MKIKTLLLALMLAFAPVLYAADGILFTTPKQTPLGSGAVIAGAQVFFYTAGTTTKQNTYTTAALSTPHANPVIADAEGKLAAIFLKPSLGDYKIVITTSSDSDPPIAPIDTVDNYPVLDTVANLASTSNAKGASLIGVEDSAGSFVGTDIEAVLSEIIARPFVLKSANFSVVKADVGKTFNVDTSPVTVSLLPVATAGDGFSVIIINSAGGIITLDGDGSEKIDIGLGPNNTQSLYGAQTVLLKSNGTKWFGIIINPSEQSLSATNKSWTSDLTLADITGLTGFDLLASGEYEFEVYLDGIQNVGNFQWKFDASINVTNGNYIWWANDESGVGAQGYTLSIESAEDFT